MKTIVRTVRTALLGALLLMGPLTFAQSAGADKPFAVTTYPAADPLKLWLNVQQNDPAGKLAVVLLDEKSRVLFTEKLPRNSRTYRQRFDLSALRDGAYTLRITDGAETVEKEFRVKTNSIQEQLSPRLLTVMATDGSQSGM